MRYDEDKYPMLANLNADPRLIGLEVSLCPFPQFMSSQRSNMFSSMSVQAMILDECESPSILSGYESEFAKYTANPTRFDQDATIITFIPKYKPNVGAQPIKATPSFTLIYIGADDNLVHSMEVSSFTKGTDGFGYENIIDFSKMAPDIGIKKGTCITHSKAIQGSKYCLGVNANTCYMTAKETVEDAFCISTSLAKKMESTGYKTLILDIDKNMIPINAYGSADEYKFMPDIGEQVREDAIICAFRTVHDSSIIADMPQEALMKIQFNHDEVYFASSNTAEIVDIDVWINSSKKVKTPDYIFEQLEKYKNGNITYYSKIIEIYEKECLKAHRGISPEFNTLVTNAASILTAYHQKTFNGNIRKTTPKFTRKNEVIPFIQLVITYKFKNVVTEGYKISSRDAGKGVVCAVNVLL